MALNTTFRYEKSIYKVFVLWHEQTDIIFETAFGVLRIDAIKENFFFQDVPSFPWHDENRPF